jgi:hypothetical protein
MWVFLILYYLGIDLDMSRKSLYNRRDYHNYLSLICITVMAKALCLVMGKGSDGDYVASPYQSAALPSIQDSSALTVFVQKELQGQFLGY